MSADRPSDARRRRLVLAAGAGAAAWSLAPRHGLAQVDPVLPRPTPSQLRWQRDEFAMFVHFGVNTFSDREWGDGREDPALFAPTDIDARQWARSARDAGARAMVLTAKHHDGFCLFPTETTRHSVASSAWRDGHGDVVREFVDACRAEQLRVGLYCSPWDRNATVYGSAAYNDVYCAQLRELLTRYGEIDEVWFDGANGEGPNGRRQTYDWPRIHALVRRLQPTAVMFSDAGPDVRWCGNERGMAGDPNWATVDPARVPFPGADSADVTAALLHGDANGPVWRPAEADVSIRPGWFYHAAEDAEIKSVEALNAIWLQSVGHNAKLLLNVPPTRAGRLHDRDVARLIEWRRARDAMFARDLAAAATPSWHVNGPRTAVTEVDLDAPARVSIIALAEPIEQGQRVACYRVHGLGDHGWRLLVQGSTIGACKLDAIDPLPLRRLRVSIDAAIAAPLPLRIRAFAAA